MQAMRLILSSAGVLGSVAMLAMPSGASVADVYVTRPRAVVVAPAPRVYVAPSRTVAVSSGCATRTARVWVDGRYIYRTVRTCP